MMRILILCVLSVVTHPAFAVDWKVEVGNVSGTAGRVKIALCDPETFLRRGSYIQDAQPDAASKLHFDFHDIPAGHYALMVYHDENANGRLDKNFMGIPKEGYGFSRQTRGRDGPPVFEHAIFDLHASDAEQSVNIEY